MKRLCTVSKRITMAIRIDTDVSILINGSIVTRLLRFDTADFFWHIETHLSHRTGNVINSRVLLGKTTKKTTGTGRRTMMHATFIICLCVKCWKLHPFPSSSYLCSTFWLIYSIKYKLKIWSSQFQNDKLQYFMSNWSVFQRNSWYNVTWFNLKYIFAALSVAPSPVTI